MERPNILLVGTDPQLTRRDRAYAQLFGEAHFQSCTADFVADRREVHETELCVSPIPKEKPCRR